MIPSQAPNYLLITSKSLPTFRSTSAYQQASHGKSNVVDQWGHQHPFKSKSRCQHTDRILPAQQQHHLTPPLKFSKDLLSICPVMCPQSCILLTTTEIPRLRISLPSLQRRKLKQAPTVAHSQQAATLLCLGKPLLLG